MKTNELTGAGLDWAVAKCEGHESRCSWILEKEGYAAWQAYEMAWGNPLPNYSTNWAQGGPIIERKGIAILQCPRGWAARIGFGGEYIEGPTPLIAAMRCYVASKLGDDIEVPEVTA
jgi:Protein of unknown function (DUF2591)